MAAVSLPPTDTRHGGLLLPPTPPPPRSQCSCGRTGAPAAVSPRYRRLRRLRRRRCDAACGAGAPRGRGGGEGLRAVAARRRLAARLTVTATEAGTEGPAAAGPPRPGYGERERPGPTGGRKRVQIEAGRAPDSEPCRPGREAVAARAPRCYLDSDSEVPSGDSGWCHTHTELTRTPGRLRRASASVAGPLRVAAPA